MMADSILNSPCQVCVGINEAKNRPAWKENTQEVGSDKGFKESYWLWAESTLQLIQIREKESGDWAVGNPEGFSQVLLLGVRQ